MMKRRIISIGIIFLVTACAPFSKSVMRQVDTSVTFSEILKSPESYQSRTIMVGGVIIETRNDKDGTSIKVLQTSLDMEKRPAHRDRSQGRFLIRYAGFLDPVIYAKGRDITVVGDIVGEEIHPLGDIQYGYPVIRVREIYLWKKREPYEHLPGPYLSPFWWDRYPYWWHGHPYYDRPVLRKKRSGTCTRSRHARSE